MTPLAKKLYSIAVCPKFDFSLIAVEDKVNLLNIKHRSVQKREGVILHNAVFRFCPVKKSAKIRTDCTLVWGGGGEDTTQVYPDGGLKILQNN